MFIVNQFKKQLSTLIILLSTFSVYASDNSKINFKKNKPVKILKTLEADPERTVVLEGVVRQANINTIIDQTNEMVKLSNKPIYLMINSPGGEVDAGFDLINQMKYLKADKNVKIYCGIHSFAASMAADIQAFCTETYATRRSKILFHQIGYGNLSGNATDLDDYSSLLSRENQEINAEIAEALGITVAEYVEKTRRNWILTATEAAKIGMIDGLLDYLVYTKPKPANAFEELLRQLSPGLDLSPRLTRL